MADGTLVGAIEGGGTKFVCGIGTGPDDLEATSFPTTTPEETLALCLAFFRDKGAGIKALGIGCFGPADVNPDSPAYGSITTTPKSGWAGTPVIQPFADEFQIPVAFDTDVNGAAIGEGNWGAAQDVGSFVYFTVGTGIGGGVVMNRNPVHGLSHPEIGHLRIPRDTNRDPFEGVCPYHGDCLEGLASGTALGARWNCDPATLPEDHEAWDLEAGYLASAIMNVVLIMSPERVILGGGVMKQAHLFPKIRSRLQDQLADYLNLPEIAEGIDRFVIPPALGSRAGILGALAMAQAAC